MTSVILIAPEPFNMSDILKSCSEIGSAVIQTATRCVVESDWGWFALEFDDKIAGEFSDLEMAEIRSYFPPPFLLCPT